MTEKTRQRPDADGPAAPPARPGPAPTPVRRPKAALPIVTYLLFAVMLSGALPTPLYSLYAARLGLTPPLIALVFALYAVGVVAALLVGGVSDQIGRRATIGPAMVLVVVSCAVFAAFPSMPGLLAGRLLSGVAVGLTTGATTAYLQELHPRPATATLLATVTNMLGLGVGPLLSGVLAQYAPYPLFTPYAVLAALLLPGLALFVLPETVVGRRGRFRMQRLGVPPQVRGVFVAAAVSVFAAFSVLGLLAGLTGIFLIEGLHNHSQFMVGLVVCSAFGSAGLTQLATARLALTTATIGGMTAIPVGLALIVTALPCASLALFLTGAVISGGGSGAAFRSGLAMVAGKAPAGRTGEVTSSYFVAAYLGLTLPVVGVGLLASSTSLLLAASVFAGIVTLLAMAGIMCATAARMMIN